MRLPPEALKLLRQAARLSPGPVHLVGGAPRDWLLKRKTHDLDLVSPEPLPLAKKLAKTARGTMVVLDPENAVYRIALGPSCREIRQVDVALLQGETLEEDLARRDFTINALALPLTPDMPASIAAGGLIDVRAGLKDVSQKILRADNEQLFRDDPLRLLRAFRLAAQLGLSIEPKTLGMIRRLKDLAREPAGERIQAELMALLSAPGSSRWLCLMDEAGLLTAVFPELGPARRCAAVYYGPGGVLKHSLAVAAREDFLLNNLKRVFPAEAEAIERALAARASCLKPLLVLAALLHDVAKPETARRQGGRLRFFGHDALGAKKASVILSKLRFSREHIEIAAAAILHHLRPGHLAAGGMVTDKAVYRFCRDLGENALSLLLVCWADHASYLPEKRLLCVLRQARAEPNPEAEKTVHHLQVIAYLMRRLLDEKKRAVPARLINGHDVMKALRIPAGPKVGELLEKVREAQAEGRIKTRQEALAFLKRI
ncbi:MAG: HD domain-containing protein [Elusimicrobia bacterium]|nr:HD domain-containing protein [Elusimicrobiota bacterium]